MQLQAPPGETSADRQAKPVQTAWRFKPHRQAPSPYRTHTAPCPPSGSHPTARRQTVQTLSWSAKPNSITTSTYLALDFSYTSHSLYLNSLRHTISRSNYTLSSQPMLSKLETFIENYDSLFLALTFPQTHHNTLILSNLLPSHTYLP